MFCRGHYVPAFLHCISGVLTFGLMTLCSFWKVCYHLLRYLMQLERPVTAKVTRVYVQYYFAYLKLYALFTLHVTSWGTRAGVGGPQDKKSAEQIDAEAKQKARELEEGFINQKARMERKRKMAEKSYWCALKTTQKACATPDCSLLCAVDLDGMLHLNLWSAHIA